MKREKKHFKYQLIHDALAARIAAGLLEQLPSEQELSKEFSAGRNIVRQALQMLSDEGYIIKERGRHTRICRRKFADPVREAKLVLLQRHDYQGANDNPVYAGIIAKLLEIAAGRGCLIELLYLPAPGNNQYARFVAEKLREADGIFLTVLRLKEPQDEIAQILSAHPRTVCIDNAVGSFGKYHVGTDNYSGGWIAAEQLAACGRKNPLIYGCGNSFSEYSPMIERAMGFRDACSFLFGNFNRNEQLILDEVSPEFHIVYSSMKKQLEAGGFFDSVFVLSDHAAVYTVRALRALGKNVPEDTAVIGFDGIADRGEFAELTSIRQNIEGVAAESFHIMEKLLRNEIITGSISLVQPAIKAGKTLSDH
ncbi:MAG: substrate-binding domain-containing protein [Lentisphaeria bacterium]|nr:substrate-binding domain-containing protein [Lentisphaeria bacterium]